MPRHFASATENQISSIAAQQRRIEASGAIFKLPHPLIHDDAMYRIPALRRALAWQPNALDQWLQLGQAYLALPRLDQATDAFRNALQLDANNIDARCGLAHALSLSGYCQDAMQICFEKLADDGSDMELHGVLVDIFARARLYEQAQKLVDAAIAKDGGRTGSATVAARLLYRLGNAKACLDILSKTLETDPTHTGALRLQSEVQKIIDGSLHPPLDKEASPQQDCKTLDTPIRELINSSRGLKVGLIWADDSAHFDAPLRSMSLSDFAPLGGIPGLTLFSFQQGGAAREAVMPPEGIDFVPLADILSSQAEVEAALTHMDLVIAVDCMAAVKAASLGCRIWVILPEHPQPYWQSFSQAEAPSSKVRLFQQPLRGQWKHTMSQVADALLDLINDPATAITLNEVQGLLIQARIAIAQYRYPEAESILRQVLNGPEAFTPQAIALFRTYLLLTGRHQLLDRAPPPTSETTASWMEDLLAFALAHGGKRETAFAIWESMLKRGIPALAIMKHYGDAAHAAQDWKRAADLWEKAMSFYPSTPAIELLAATSYSKLQEHDKAIACLRRSLALSPFQASAHLMLGTLLRDRGEMETAAQHLQLAAYLAPGNAQAWANLGHLFYQHGDRYRVAAVCFSHAIDLQPDHYNHSHLAYCHYHSKDYVAAVAEFDRALALQPADKNILYYKGDALLLLEKNAEAISVFEKLVELHGGMDKVPENIRKALFILYLKEKHLHPRYPDIYWGGKECAGTRWKGEELHGKTLLIYQDSGFGDSIQCARYVQILKQQKGAGKIILAVWPELKRFYQQLSGVDEVHSIFAVKLQEMPADFHIDEYSLLGLRERDAAAQSLSLPLLKADPELVKLWKARLAKDSNFKVGIAWAGNPGHRHDKVRSSALADWLVLADIPGLSLYTLQKGDALAQAYDVPGLHLHLPGNTLNDFADTAALVSCLDLVISVDSVPAHLAGALGTPAWTLLPSFQLDWRWPRDGETSSNYPSMRLFRHRDAHTWPEVLLRVRKELAELVAQSGHAPIVLDNSSKK